MPVQEVDEVYPDLDSAVAAAQRWQAEQSQRATVEVIGLAGGVGNVLAVVDSSGTERLGGLNG
jgi:hypothetical protein